MLRISKLSVLIFAGVMTLLFLFGGFMPTSKCLAVTQEGKVRASLLMDYDSGQILSENNSTEGMPIASVTKLMTILLTLESIDNKLLDEEQVITASETAAGMGGSQVFLEAGGEYKVIDLLKAAIICSANDASVLLAESISGSEADFCNLMNKRAKELGLTNTNYANATGLPAPMQYSSAQDVAMVMREVLKHPLYLNLSSIWMEDFAHPKGRITTMSNTNKLLKTYDLCDGGKTGSTAEAGYCLCATAQNGNMRLISVVLGADSGKTRFAESRRLLEYGFNTFESKKLVDKSLNLGENIRLEKAQENDLQVFAEKDYSVVVKKGETSSISAELCLPESIKAPLKVGDKIGTIKVLDNGVLIEEINVLVNNDVDAMSYLKIIQNITKRWQI